MLRYRVTRCLVIFSAFWLSGCRLGFDDIDPIRATENCADNVQNQNESDVDCGGSCGACVDGAGCHVAEDCDSRVCTANICQAPVCVDKVQNHNESDVDCGGVCAGCKDGANCNVADDCLSLVCTVAICQVPTCNDNVRNQDEIGIDCGGAICNSCGPLAPLTKFSSSVDNGAMLRMGSAVAVDGTYAIVGASGSGSSLWGTAYVYERDGVGVWNQVAQLSGAGGVFGTAVSLSGSYAIVGAKDDGNPGAAYVYERDGIGVWNQVVKLVPSDGVSNDDFGISVAVDGDYAVVGAFLHDIAGDDAGAVYVYERDGLGNWNEVQKLIASDGFSGDSFGRAVALSGSDLFVGAPFDDDLGTDSGSAYVFKRDGLGNWNEVTKLTSSDGASDDFFAHSLSLDGDYALVGAYLDDDNGSDSGSAYVFERDGLGNWNEVDKLIAADVDIDDRFGFSSSLRGDYAVVGAYQDDDNGSNSGSAYVFERDGLGNWNEVDKLLASDGQPSDLLAFSAAIDGNYVFVGAHLSNDNGLNSGSAYVYERSGLGVWSEQVELHATNTNSGDSHGTAVAVSGDYAVVGAPQDGDLGLWSGSAFVYERGQEGGWTEVTKLVASDGATNDWFGRSVAVSSRYAFVGAYWDDDRGQSSGSVYVFERDGLGNWNEVQKLTASDGAASAWFGNAIAITETYAVVGARNAEAAYVFERDGLGDWTEVAKLAASDGVASDEFGISVAIDEEYVIIGACFDDDNGAESGSAQVFERDGLGNWNEVQKLTASDAAASDFFGCAVGVSGNQAIIGAYGDDDNGTQSGSVYVFERDGLGNWNEVQKLIASDGANTDRLGWSVAVRGEFAVFGSPNDDEGASSAGSGYVYWRDPAGVWNFHRKLLADDGAFGDHLGHAVAVSGRTVWLGSESADAPDRDSGAAYVFEL